MKRLKLLKNLLVALDAILIIAIVILVFQSFLFPANIDWLANMPEKGDVKTKITPPPPIQYYKVISLLPNPIERKEPEKFPERRDSSLARLLQVEGTMPNARDPKKASALLRLITKSQTVIAYYGEEILDQDGNKVPGLEGVKIVEVYFNKVVFDDNNERKELLAPIAEVPPVSVSDDTLKKGTSHTFTRSYDSKEFSTERTKNDGDRQEWEVDERERDWLMENSKAVIENDVTLSPISGGGVKIASVKSGSIVLSRGFQSGDIIKKINDAEIKSVEKAYEIFNDKPLRGSQKITVVIDRAGRDITIEYRLKRDAK